MTVSEVMTKVKSVANVSSELGKAIEKAEKNNEVWVSISLNMAEDIENARDENMNNWLRKKVVE